jgi:hypothetical protein
MLRADFVREDAPGRQPLGSLGEPAIGAVKLCVDRETADWSRAFIPSSGFANQLCSTARDFDSVTAAQAGCWLHRCAHTIFQNPHDNPRESWRELL